MTNNKFGKLIDANHIEYAPVEVRIDGHIVINPTAESYAAAVDGPWIPVNDKKPDPKEGVYYVATEWEVRENEIWRKYEEREVVEPEVTYIVEEVIYQLITAGKLHSVKQVVGDYWELLTMRDTISASNPMWSETFPQICAQLMQAGTFSSQDEIDAIMQKCRTDYMDKTDRETV